MRTTTLAFLILSACSDIAAPRRLVVIKGEGNALGAGAPDDAAGDPRLAPLEMPYVTELGVGDLRAGATFGIEMSLGHALERAEPGRWAIAKFTAAGSPLARWSIGGDLHEPALELEREAVAAAGADLAAEIWIHGETDARDLRAATRYEPALLELVACERDAVGAVPWFVGRLNDRAIAPASVTMRAAQEDDQSAELIVVDQDPYALALDRAAYTSSSYLALGEAYAAAILATSHVPE